MQEMRKTIRKSCVLLSPLLPMQGGCMTPQEVASFAFAQEFIGWTAFVVGFIVSGFFKTLLNHIAHRFNRPRRIKYRSLNLKNHDFEYLYLFRGRYYEKAQYDFLIKEHKQALRK